MELSYLFLVVFILYWLFLMAKENKSYYEAINNFYNKRINKIINKRINKIINKIINKRINDKVRIMV